jgi:hypothetical protein
MWGEKSKIEATDNMKKEKDRRKNQFSAEE